MKTHGQRRDRESVGPAGYSSCGLRPPASASGLTAFRWVLDLRGNSVCAGQRGASLPELPSVSEMNPSTGLTVEEERYTPAASMGRDEHTESKAVTKTMLKK
jgi:hypothetical protein